MSNREIDDKTDDFDRNEIDSAELPERPSDADDLPPVQPPSAGFIIQLFLVPAVIVLVIVGLFLTVRTLVSGNQDWQSLVAELRSSNEHRRWRGAHGLAQMLQADAHRGDEGEHLSLNPQIAKELTALTKEQLDKHSNNDDDKLQLAFLALTLGYLDSPDLVFPVLKSAMQPDQDLEVRKNAIASTTQIVARSLKETNKFESPALTADLIAVSADGEPLMRQMSAYLLGLFSDKESHDRLTVMLHDSNEDARLNAAIGLARRKSTAGFEVFKETLENGNKTFDLATVSGDTDQTRQENLNALQFQQLLTVSNSLKAVNDIARELSDSQRGELRQLIEPLAAEHRESRIRTEAEKALKALGTR